VPDWQAASVSPWPNHDTWRNARKPSKTGIFYFCIL